MRETRHGSAGIGKLPWTGAIAHAFAAMVCWLVIPHAVAQLPDGPPAVPAPPDRTAPEDEAPQGKERAPADSERQPEVEADRQEPADVEADIEDAAEADADTEMPPKGRAKADAEADIEGPADVEADAEGQADAEGDVRGRTRGRTAEPADEDRSTREDEYPRDRAPRDREPRDRVDRERLPEPGVDAEGRFDAGAEPGTELGEDRRVDAGGRTQIGVQFQGGDQLVVREVQRGGVALRAGLRVDDEIVAVNGRRVISEDEFHVALQSAARGRAPVALSFWRDGELHRVRVSLAADVGSIGRRSYYRGPDETMPLEGTDATDATEADVDVYIESPPRFRRPWFRYRWYRRW